jgi:hypothetical protein
MAPKVSLQHSQVPTTCPCPEPHQSSPCPHIPLLEHLNIIPPSTTVYFPQVSPPKPGIDIPSALYVLHAQTISLSIWSPEQYLVSSTDHYLVFSIPPLPPHLRPKYSPQRPILKLPQPPPSVSVTSELCHIKISSFYITENTHTHCRLMVFGGNKMCLLWGWNEHTQIRSVDKMQDL